MVIPLNSLEELHHSQEFLEDVSKYSNYLQNRGLPVIYSLKHLSLLSDISIEFLNDLCSNRSRTVFYKRYKLRKKTGGFRVIQTPIESLKYLQRWILINIIDSLPTHESCHGFEKGKSILSNAKNHLNSAAILKMDLLRFYDTINERRVYGLFKNLGYHPNLAVSLAKICTITPDNLFISSFKDNELLLKKKIRKSIGILPQGAPTSPKLANLLCISMDNRLNKLSQKYELKYSRYADDITFSGDLENIEIIKKIIPRIIVDESFFINHTKTKIIKRGHSFMVTGLSVVSDHVTVQKKYKKTVEHHLHHCLKNGVINHLTTMKINNRNFKDWLLGSIAYIYSIEKETGKKFLTDYNKIDWPL